jgi:hypothetical protein
MIKKMEQKIKKNDKKLEINKKKKDKKLNFFFDKNLDIAFSIYLESTLLT